MAWYLFWCLGFPRFGFQVEGSGLRTLMLLTLLVSALGLRV